MPQLEAHHLVGLRQFGELALLLARTLEAELLLGLLLGARRLEQLLQQQRVLAHALHGLQQVARQVHAVA